MISQVRVGHQALRSKVPWSALERVDVPYDANAVTFEFAALDFTDPTRNHYRYQLEGFDDQWIELGNQRTAAYTNLDGGRYRLRVQGASSQGAWSEQALSLAINVGTPPWRSPYAYAALLALLVLGVWQLVASQQRRLARAARYRARLEAEVASRTTALQESNAALQKLSEAKGEFLARMSHELRSPINGVIGMADLLQDTSLTNKQSQFVETISQSAKALLRTINDILDFSKLDSRKLNLELAEADLEVVADDVVEMFALQAHEQGIELVCQLPADGLPTVLADELRVKQVLVNLVGNAVKFTTTGHVMLSIDCRDNGFVFAVTDTGIGIASEHLERIFESFSQATTATARQYGGTGLGLSISKELVELMGGSLSVESTQEAGSRFEFHLPLALADVHSLSQQRWQTWPQAHAIVAIHQRVLAATVVRYLQGWGISVISVHTQQAFEAARARLGPNALCCVDRRTQIQVPADAHAVYFDALDSPARSWADTLAVPVRRRLLQQRISDCLGPGVDMPPSLHRPERESGLSGRVLLVEDDAVNRDVVVAMLDSLGCTSAVAATGAQGIQLATTEHFDLVLMDYRLPDTDGIAATRRIRDAGVTRLPIVALTATASAEQRSRCLAAGMNGFLTKPCERTVLAACLGRWLNHAEEPRVEFDEAEFSAEMLDQVSTLHRPDGSSMLVHTSKLFKQSADECLTTMQLALSDQDFTKLKTAAHKLRSACGLLGLVGMADLCRDIENSPAPANGASPQERALAEQQVALLQTKLRAAEDWLAQRIDAAAQHAAQSAAPRVRKT